MRRLNDRAEFSVLRVEEVHVARRADRNAQLLAQPDDFSVKVAKLFLVLRHALAQHKRIVADRLNFEVVVEPRNPLELRVVFAVRNGAEQLARFARGADDEALAVLVQNAFRRAGTLIEII